MADLKPKLSFITSQFRVTVELTKEICMANPNAIPGLIQRAINKLESIRNKGQIDLFVIYEERLRSTWKALLADNSIQPKYPVKITLGLGGIRLKGIEFHPIQDSEENVLAISIKAEPTIVKKWHNSDIRANVDSLIQKTFKKQFQVSCAQIQGVMIRAKSGIPQENVAIAKILPVKDPSELKEKPYIISVNKSRKEIILTIRTYAGLRDPNVKDHILKKLHDAAKMLLSKSGDHYSILEQNLQENLRELEHSQEYLDVELPMTVLVGIILPENKPKSAFKISVSSDKMKAVITDFNIGIYDKVATTQDWCIKQLQLLGLSKNSYMPFLTKVMDLIEEKKDLNGITIAKGIEAKPNQKPYLNESYKHTKNRDSIAANSTTVINIRDSQQVETVNCEDLVAEICYVLPGQQGENIFGKKTSCSTSETLEIKSGNGIKRVGDKFIATVDGLPIISEEEISIKEVYVHTGDVNLRTGNIYFQGPLEINGCIDCGATVIAQGDIKIRGDIRGTVISKGSITCSGGIITGQQAKVQAEKFVKAEFIENSVIYCAGDIVARKVLLNSDVICGGSIFVIDRTNGVLAGGNISCMGDINTNNLGFQRGAKTFINAGVDWKIEQKIAIKKSRKQKIEDFNKEARLELRELVKKRANQMTPKHVALKEVLQKKLTQSREIIEILDDQIKEISSKLAYNTRSVIYVDGIICANVRINIGGSTVSIDNDIAAVAVVGKKRRGSNVIQIEEARQMKKEDAS